MRRRLLSLSIGALLAPAAFAGEIVGQISDNTGARALAGATVTIPALGRSTVSGTDGSFRFADVPAGDHRIIASYVGAEPVEQQIEVTDTGVARADIGVGSATDDSIIVVGQRAVMASALSRQRASDTIDSVLTRDAIGQFPDQNVAEAIRRAPGVNVLNDQGEGRFVAIRGLNKDLNSVSINGARVPAPEAGARFVALDVIPTDLIESIDIRKSLTPDMDADTIGGSVEISTTSALARHEPYIGFSLENSYNDLSGDSSPKAAIDFSRNFDDTLGIAGGISYYERSFSTDNVEASDWGETDGGIVFAESVEYRDYDVERERLGISLSADLRPTDAALLYARLLHSEFDDQEYRARLGFGFDEEPSSGGPNSARFLSDDGPIAVERDLKDRFESQTISSLVAGAELYTGPWSIEFSGSISKAEEKETDSFDPTSFEREFEDPGEFDVSFDYGRLILPAFTVNAGAPEFLDPAEYEFDAIERTTLGLSEDDEAAFEISSAREFALERGVFAVQFGVKQRLRDKSYDNTTDIFEDYDFTLADVLGRSSYGLIPIDPVPAPSPIRQIFGQNFGSFERDDVGSDFASAVEDYVVEEDILAGFVAGRYESGPIRVVFGLRYEETSNEMQGNLAEEVAEGSTYNGVLLTEDTVFVTRVTSSREYDDVYPSVNLRYDLGENLVFRAGYYESLVRPNIAWLAPRFEIGEEDDEREGVFGNPELNPYQATNLDISAEWYFANNAVISAGVFMKDVEDFIVVGLFEDVTFNGIFADEAEIPVNGDKASIEGLEVNYQHALTGRGGPWSGMLFGINYTYTVAEGKIEGRTIPLPETSDNVMNGVVGYERNQWSLRLAATYRAGYLDEVAFTGDSIEDRYVKQHTQFDLGARYDVTDNLQVFLDLINLTDEPYIAYQAGPGLDRLLQYEEYSWTGKLGFRMTF